MDIIFMAQKLTGCFMIFTKVTIGLVFFTKLHTILSFYYWISTSCVFETLFEYVIYFLLPFVRISVLNLIELKNFRVTKCFYLFQAV